MSRAFLGLAATFVATSGIIYYVHWEQKKELRRMKEGVFQDALREQSRIRALRDETGSTAASTHEEK